MKKSAFQFSFLKVLYLILFLILFSVIFIIPILIKDNINLTEKLIIEEEIVEGSLLCILFFLSLVLSYFYKREIDKQNDLIKKIENDKKTAKEKLLDSFKYIGKINVQIQEIKSIFNSINLFPETKNDFKKTLFFLSDRILGIVNVDWVLLRIIDIKTQKTISEHYNTRGNISYPYPHLSNKMIIEKQSISNITSIISNRTNLNIIISCNLPIESVDNEQQIFIKAIVNELIMLFIILNSSYYQNENNSLQKGKIE